MAKRPNLKVVDEFSDLADEGEEELASAMAPSAMFFDLADGAGDGDYDEPEAGVDLEDALDDLRELIDDAVDFINAEMLPAWERAEEFYSGETDVPKEKGRSQVTETVLRDAVRMIKPNAMRVFVQFPEIIEYSPANPVDFTAAAIAQSQTTYANQLFWNSDGYSKLNDTIHNSVLKRVAVLKAHRRTITSDAFVDLSNVPAEQLQALYQMDDVTVTDVQPMDDTVTDLLRVTVAVRRESAENVLDSVALPTFFVDDQATGVHDCRVIGERVNRTVGEAREMGLEYDGDWMDLDAYDVGTDAGAGEEATRRGYNKKERDDLTDEASHNFLLTEAYAKFDLAGTGIPQTYRFWLGGTNYEYIAHDRVDDNPYGACCGDPLPGAFFGRSLCDVLDEDQNAQTSVLRATLDNAHSVNNRRLAVHDTLVNMGDVLNKTIGAPIRFRTPGMIQEIGVESTLGTMLPLLQHLRQSSEVKAGVTNAAMGLDPDAMQSTDKDAVKNTIQLAQGQIELFCRNIAETGLRTVFMKLLTLSLRHPPKDHHVFIGGQPVPLQYAMFDPRMTMKVRVGLGTGNAESRIAALQNVYQEQKQIIQNYGLDNPICSITHMMNCLVDIGTLMGLPNMGRYFSAITPDMAKQLDAHMQARQAAQQPEPPSAAVAIAEQIRGEANINKQQMVNDQETAMKEADTLTQLARMMLDDDFRRDKMDQDLEIAAAQQAQSLVDKDAVRREQEAERNYDLQKSLLTIGAQRRAQTENQQHAMMMKREADKQAQQQQQQQQPQQGQQPGGVTGV